MSLLRGHADTLEADFARVYHLNLWADLGSDRLTWRRFGVLAALLPADAWTTVAIHGDNARWGIGEQLLAVIADEVRMGNWQRARAHFKGKPKAPKPIRRPGLPDDETRIGGKGMSIVELRVALERHKEA